MTVVDLSSIFGNGGITVSRKQTLEEKAQAAGNPPAPPLSGSGLKKLVLDNLPALTVGGGIAAYQIYFKQDDIATAVKKSLGPAIGIYVGNQLASGGGYLLDSLTGPAGAYVGNKFLLQYYQALPLITTAAISLGGSFAARMVRQRVASY